MMRYTMLRAGEAHQDPRVNKTREALGRTGVDLLVGCRDGHPCELLDGAGVSLRLRQEGLREAASLEAAIPALEGAANAAPTRNVPLPADLIADALPQLYGARVTLALPAAATPQEEADAQAELLCAVGVEPEDGVGIPWRAGAFYAEGATVRHTDGEVYRVHIDHVSSWEYIPGTPTGAVFYALDGEEAPGEIPEPWMVGRHYSAGQLILHTDGETYRVTLAHTAGWSAVPGGNDPAGLYERE